MSPYNHYMDTTTFQDQRDKKKFRARDWVKKERERRKIEEQYKRDIPRYFT